MNTQDLERLEAMIDDNLMEILLRRYVDRSIKRLTEDSDLNEYMTSCSYVWKRDGSGLWRVAAGFSSDREANLRGEVLQQTVKQVHDILYIGKLNVIQQLEPPPSPHGLPI